MKESGERPTSFWPDGAFIDTFQVMDTGKYPTDDDYTSTINSKTYTISLQAVNLTGVTDYSTTRIVKSAGSNTPSENHNLWTATEHIGASGTNTDFTITSVFWLRFFDRRIRK